MNLQSINKNDTAVAVLKFLSRRARISNYTHLLSFKRLLIRQGFNINEKDFYGLFEQLQAEDLGYVANVDSEELAKFVWKYSLKDVAAKVLSPNKKTILLPIVTTAKAKRGRPKGSKNKIKVRKPRIITPQKEVIFFFTTHKGEMFPISLRDFDVLTKQVQEIKSKAGV